MTVRIGLVACVLWIGVACTQPVIYPNNTTKACTPGDTEQCLCTNGQSGVHVCADDGARWEKCICGVGGNDASGATDTGSTPDVSAPADTGPGDVGCTINFGKTCVGNELYWVDSCGTKGQLYLTCKTGESCVGGECKVGCQAKAKQGCVNNNIYWFDSCGAKGSIAQTCQSEEFCKEDTKAYCVKAFLSGIWMTTADPSSKTLGGIFPATFQPTAYEFKFDGTNVTVTDKTATDPYSLTGTIDWSIKTVKATGTYSSPTGTSSKYSMSVQFLSLESYAGTLIEDVTADLGGGPQSLGSVVWNITGKKQQ